ncbi:hypothetical protein [Ruania zhangjianzhongii]|uniref:hypothetical protein n=1 Tax=Ruania zhangjianzhongii TaxID=2603206 RepID=UPI0011CB0E24|nr:hypothetical protein [Ruania zhangjianzhongii]
MSTWLPVLPVLLVAVAVALLTAPGRRARSAAGGVQQRAGRAATVPIGSDAAASERGRRGPLWRSGRRGRGGQHGEADLPFGSVLVEVAARLRTGAALPAAWQATLAGQPGAPATLAELADSVPTGPRADAVAGARTAVAVADRLGTPVADVLECCAQGLAEAEEGAGQRRTAMAAPRATARLLAWLPLAGLGLGVLLGVDPIAVFADGGSGTASLLLGLAMMALGRKWSAALVRRAEQAGI